MEVTNPYSKISLGSVQWGGSYGISNEAGITPLKEVDKILKISNEFGIALIDTAPNYGNAELNLGKLNLDNFKVITKTPKFVNKIITSEDTKLLEEVFSYSLKNLASKNIYGLLIHQSEDLLKPGNKLLIKKLLQFKENGLVEKIGISIYDFEILERICDFFIPDIVQLPLNIFEIYLSGKLSFLKKNKIEVHARSIFLQGLLLMDYNKIPIYFQKWKNKFLDFESLCIRNKITKLQACLDFINNIYEVDKFILGFNDSYQLRECLDAIKISNSKVDFSKFVSIDKYLINPSNWKL